METDLNPQTLPIITQEINPTQGIIKPNSVKEQTIIDKMVAVWLARQ